jgi:23S rRNA U2552 (ribose-2'-O)-methylase RlmE/FtsJ
MNKVEKTIEIEDDTSTKRYDNLIHNVKEVMKIFNYRHDIKTETYINYLSNKDLIDFSYKVLYDLTNINNKIEGKTKEKYLLDLGISIIGLDIIEQKKKYSSVKNIDQTYKDEETELAVAAILKNAITKFKDTTTKTLISDLSLEGSYLTLIESAISLYANVYNTQTLTNINVIDSYDTLESLFEFSGLIDTCINSVEYIYTTTDEKDVIKTLGRKFDSITKFFEFDNYDDPGYPEDGDNKKIIKFLLNQATTLNHLLSNHIEVCKEDGIDADSCSIMSVLLDDFSKYTFGTYYYLKKIRRILR